MATKMTRSRLALALRYLLAADRRAGRHVRPVAPEPRAASRVIVLAGAVLPGELQPVGVPIRNRPRLSVPPRRLNSALGLP